MNEFKPWSRLISWVDPVVKDLFCVEDTNMAWCDANNIIGVPLDIAGVGNFFTKGGLPFVMCPVNPGCHSSSSVLREAAWSLTNPLQPLLTVVRECSEQGFGIPKSVTRQAEAGERRRTRQKPSGTKQSAEICFANSSNSLAITKMWVGTGGNCRNYRSWHALTLLAWFRMKLKLWL